MACVYLIVNTISQKCYVGKTVNFKTRWKAHRVDSRRDQPKSYIGRAIKKHGVVNFTITILADGLTEEAAYIEESRQIALLGSNLPGKGYNLDSGGMGGKVASAETRRKQSIAHKGKPRTGRALSAWHTPESRAKAAATSLGRIQSQETRAKIAAAHQGRAKDPLAVERSAAGHRGKPLQPEHRAKLSAANQGKAKSPEHRAKISAALRAKHAQG